MSEDNIKHLKELINSACDKWYGVNEYTSAADYQVVCAAEKEIYKFLDKFDLVEKK